MDSTPPASGPYWRSFDAYLRERFGAKVLKIPLDAGFSCPNRERGGEGCSFCDNAAFSPHAVRPGGKPAPLDAQIETGLARAARRGARACMAYFQAFTNTYAPIAALKDAYDRAAGRPGIVALAVGTRPDCVGDDVLELLASYCARVEVWLELGLQSANDETLARLNRGHTYAQFLDAVARCRRFPLKLCVHVIIGLPGETRARGNRTADELAALSVHGLKLHPLQILAGTRLAEEHARGAVALISEDEFVARAADFLERTPPDVVIQRLTADALGPALIAPSWSRNKQRLLAKIADELARRGTRQGARAPAPPSPCIGAGDSL